MNHYKIDLTGKQYGKLTVIRLADKEERLKGKRTWICKCECGKYCKILSSDLYLNKRSNCGDRSEHHWAKNDLIGKTFGHLYVLKEAPRNERKYNMRSWICKCDCGNETIVPTAFLNNGSKRSCGHKCKYSHEWRKVWGRLD